MSIKSLTGTTGTTRTFYGRTYIVYSIEPSNHTQQLHHIHPQYNKQTIANCFIKQFTNTVKHATHRINRSIDRGTQNIQGYNITLTTSQVQETIKQNKNNNSQGPDKLNIRYLNT